MNTRMRKAIWIAGLVGQILIRAPIERQRRQNRITVDQADARERAILGALAVGSGVFPLIYIFTRWLDRANYPLSARASARLGWLGAALMGGGLVAFWRSHADLGRNWSPSLQIREDHSLITRGIYRHIRHPMYASQWLFLAGQALLLQNWVAGPGALLSFWPLYALRVPREEQMMLDTFGDEYRHYMDETGRILPRLR